MLKTDVNPLNYPHTWESHHKLPGDVQLQVQGHPNNRLDIDIKLLQIIYLNPETKCLLRVHFVVEMLKNNYKPTRNDGKEACYKAMAGGWSDQDQEGV